MEVKLKIGFLGFGSIANIVFDKLIEDMGSSVFVKGALDPFIGEEKKKKLIDNKSKIYNSIEEMLSDDIDYVVEAAGGEVLNAYASDILSKGLNLICVSSGGLVDQVLISNMDNYKGKLYISGGALPCIDAVSAAMAGEVTSVHIATRKPIKGLKGAPGINIDLDTLKSPYTIFDGTVKEAIALFPKNVNVAVTVSLAGIGPDKTTASIIADPSIESNIHEVEITGEFGKFSIKTEGLPSKNPKTSLLAGYSVVSLIRKLNSNVIIG